jgi:hypothetical protein
MPEFRFALVRGDHQFPLGGSLELLDGDAACAQAEFAIKQVFESRDDARNWSDCYLSIRNKENEEFAVASINETIAGPRSTEESAGQAMA